METSIFPLMEYFVKWLFKIDLIVWKLILLLSNSNKISKFKIDLIVWKQNLDVNVKSMLK